jgi:hypothetical protein
MDFPSAVAAPRICYAGERFFMVRPLSFEGHAIVLQWLDDVIPGREERKLPPAISSDEAQAALQSPTGKALMIWLALRDHGVGENEAAEISDGLSEVERYVFIRALQTRRRTRQPAENTIDIEPGDIAETWCSSGLAKLVEKLGLDAFKLTIDQYEWLMADGNLEGENPAESPEKLGEIQAAMEAKWGEKLAALKIASEGQG